MDSFIGHLLKRPSTTSPQFDVLPIKMQVSYLRQQNNDLKKSMSQQQRLITRYSKDRKNLNDKVYKLENQCSALLKEIESLQLQISELNAKICSPDNTSPTSPISYKITSSSDLFECPEFKYRISNFTCEESAPPKQIAKSNMNLLRIPSISNQPGSSASSVSNFSDRSHVKIISSSNKKLIIEQEQASEKTLKTLKSIRSDPNLHQYVLQKSQSYISTQHQKPTSRKMNYLEKLNKRLQEKSNG